MSDTTDNHASSPAEQRLLDLLADRAVFGLDVPEEQELERLLAAHSLHDPDALDRLAAAVAASPPGADKLPEAVKSRLAEALRFAQRRIDPLIEPAGRRAPTAASPRRSLPPSFPRMAAAGLLCALATFAMIVVAVRLAPVRGPGRFAPMVFTPPGDAAAVAEAAGSPVAKPAPTPAALRDAMLTAVNDVLRLDCAAAVSDEQQTSGDVVWSGSRQRGFLRISGLSPNDPAERQYQIWIVEGGRGRPVAGGVFDVGGEAEEVIVPILPRVFVQAPTTFVVTVEKPGGAEEYSEERSRVLARVR
jgi:hypothetical protein